MVNRSALMRRMEEARAGGKVTKWLSSKSDFKKNKDAPAARGPVAGRDFRSHQGQGLRERRRRIYQKYAAELQKQCLVLTEAVKGDDQDKAQSTFAQISKACDSCHGEFR